MEQEQINDILADWRKEIHEMGIFKFKHRYGELAEKIFVALEIAKPVGVGR